MVLNRWKDAEAKEYTDAAGNNPADVQLALRVYTSRLIGQDHDLVLHGGGNTSCKVKRKDIFGNEIDVLHVKGSGCDLEFTDAKGLPGLRLEPLQALRALKTLDDQDMISIRRASLLDASAPNPSIETLLHAFLPHKFIDHTHATAMITLADLPNAEDVVKEIFGDRLAVVPFVKPGFGLAKLAADIHDANPGIEGLLLLNHGHFAFGDSARQSYDRLIEQTNMAEEWLIRKTGGTPKSATANSREMTDRAGDILPMLRGMIGKENAEFTGNRDHPMPVMDLRNGENVQEFLARDDLPELARAGVATPDHVIRTKNFPLYLPQSVLSAGPDAVARAVGDYVTEYTAYFERNNARYNGEMQPLLPTPNVAWIEGVGVVGIAENAHAASIASDLAAQNLTAMIYGVAAGGFHPISEADLFDMEYWALEQAKIDHSTPPAFQGRVVIVTGGGGAIGLATAQEFAKLGANIFLVDLEQSALERGLETLGPGHSGMALDVTRPEAAESAMNACIQTFGGLDILVSNAGAAWTGEMTELPDETLRKSFELNFFSHRNFATAAARLFETQGRGGQILFNVSKQAVNPGKGFGAYGLPKAATFFLLRQLALELGPKAVRVNGINADRIRSGLLDEAFVAERAKARGIDEATYMAGNLIRREVEAKHVGLAFVALAQSERTTAHVMTVDGGNIEAALR